MTFDELLNLMPAEPLQSVPTGPKVDADGYPINIYKPYYWNSPLVDGYDHTLPVGSIWEEDVYYRPEYAVLKNADAYYQTQDGVPIYSHMRDHINYITTIPPSYYSAAQYNTAMSDDDSTIVDNTNLSEEYYAEHRHSIPTPEMLDENAPLPMIGGDVAKFVNKMNLTKQELMNKMMMLNRSDDEPPVQQEQQSSSIDGIPLSLNDLIALSNRNKSNEQLPPTGEIFFENYRFDDKGAPVLVEDEKMIEPEYDTTISVGGQGYNEQPSNKIPINAEVEKYNVYVPTSMVQPNNGFNPYIQQPIQPFFGFNPAPGPIGINPYGIPQPNSNGYVFSPVVWNNQNPYSYQQRTDYYNPYPNWQRPYQPNYMPFNNQYGYPVYNPFMSMQMQEQMQANKTKMDKLRYKLSCIGAGVPYNDDEADKMYNPQNEVYKKSKEEIERDQYWNRVQNYSYWCNNPNPYYQSQEQIHAAFVQLQFKNYHEYYDNHSLCEFLEEDYPRLMRDFWIDENIKKNATRDLSRTYSSKDYNDLLKMHATANPYLNKMMAESSKYDNNLSDVEIGLIDTLHRNVNPNFKPSSQPSWLSNPEIQEQRRKFTEALMEQVYRKNNISKPDKVPKPT